MDLKVLSKYSFLPHVWCTFYDFFNCSFMKTIKIFISKYMTSLKKQHIFKVFYIYFLKTDYIQAVFLFLIFSTSLIVEDEWTNIQTTASSSHCTLAQFLNLPGTRSLLNLPTPSKINYKGNIYHPSAPPPRVKKDVALDRAGSDTDCYRLLI